MRSVSNRNQAKDGKVKMRAIKKGSIIAIGAATILLIATTSAHATETALCEVPEDPCPAGKPYPQGTEFRAQLLVGTKVKFLTQWMAVECGGSVIDFINIGVLASPLSIGIERLAFQACGNCRMATAFEFASILRTAFNHGTIQFEPLHIEVDLCGIFEECLYVTPEAEGVVEEGKSGESEFPPTLIKVHQVELLLETGGFFCPKMAKLDATWKITTPAAVFVTE
jgi:hypothetical protein